MPFDPATVLLGTHYGATCLGEQKSPVTPPGSRHGQYGLLAFFSKGPATTA